MSTIQNGRNPYTCIMSYTELNSEIQYTMMEARESGFVMIHRDTIIVSLKTMVSYS